MESTKGDSRCWADDWTMDKILVQFEKEKEKEQGKEKGRGDRQRSRLDPSRSPGTSSGRDQPVLRDTGPGGVTERNFGMI